MSTNESYKEIWESMLGIASENISKVKKLVGFFPYDHRTFIESL